MLTTSITFDGTIIHCRVSGPNSEANVLQYLHELHVAMEHHDCGKVMVVEHLEGPGLNLLQIYHIIRTARKTVLALPHAIAYIDANPHHHHRSLQFAETVALNRFIHLRLFTNEEQAITWLRSMTL